MKVLWLQWRGMAIVCLLVIDAVAYAVVFIKLDQTQINIASGKNGAQTINWIECIVMSGGDKDACYPLAAKFMIAESTVVAILILLSVSRKVLSPRILLLQRLTR
jgi:hypothetical protein